MLEHIAAQPFWLAAWIVWLLFINGLSVCFVGHSEGRWVLAAGVAILATLHLLSLRFGDSRILGLAYLVWWTPLVVYLFRRRASFGESGFGGWARLLVLTNAAAVAVHAAGVVRFLLGDRAAA